MRVTSSFLGHYRRDRTSAARLERVLAVGRAFLTVTAFLAIYLDPTEPARLAALTYGVLLAYACYSLAVLAWLRGGGRVGPRHGRVLHGLDILWTSGLTFVSEGPISPFFLFFLFVVAASAYRWGFRETVATAATIVAIFLIETAVVTAGAWNALFESPDVALNRTILRIAYLLLTGFLLGYLAEQEKQSRVELAAIADLPRQPRVDQGLRGYVTALAEGLLRMFNAATVAIVIQEHDRMIATAWRLDAGADRSGGAQAVRHELDAAAQAIWLFDDPAPAWQAMLVGGSPEASFRATEAGLWRLRRLTSRLPDALLTEAPTTIMAVNMGLAGEWRGRIYLFDAAASDSVERRVHFLEVVAEHIAPALTNVVLLRRLHSQVSAVERARVARELHDGAIQSLIGMEMKLEALRRRPARTDIDMARELGEVQDALRHEILALRELMQALRPVELDAHEKLPDVLASVVERFRRDSGISARFAALGATLSLPPGAAIEIVRIVQEALVNVRKHSHAENVLVRLSQQDGQVRLEVEDDGRGFEFEGAFDGAALDARRLGPAIIKERARMLGARLVVQSAPGSGARIEVTLHDTSTPVAITRDT